MLFLTGEKAGALSDRGHEGNLWILPGGKTCGSRVGRAMIWHVLTSELNVNVQHALHFRLCNHVFMYSKCFDN